MNIFLRCRYKFRCLVYLFKQGLFCPVLQVSVLSHPFLEHPRNPVFSASSYLLPYWACLQLLMQIWALKKKGLVLALLSIQGKSHARKFWFSSAGFLPGHQALGKTHRWHRDFYFLLFLQCLAFPFTLPEHLRSTFYFIFYLKWCMATLPAPSVHNKSCPHKPWSTQRKGQLANYPGCL